MKLIILTKEDVANVLTMQDTIEAMRHCFMQLGANQTIIPLRTAINIPQTDAVSLFMPAFMPKDQQLGIKIVSSFPMNTQKHIPSITGAILLLNSQTGEPKALIEASLLTALRTGAASGLATDIFAKDDAKHLAIIGSGVQAKTQLEAVLAVRKISKVSIFSRNKRNAETFAATMKTKFQTVNFSVYDKVKMAAEDADIICTATNSTEPLLYSDYLKQNCHINAIGSHSRKMKEIDISVLRQAKIIVDQRSAAIAEAGEIIEGLENNVVHESDLIELGDALNKPHEQERLKNSLTLFKSVGLAIQDLAAAERALERAIREKIGTIIDF